MGLTAVLLMGIGLRAAHLKEHLSGDATLHDASGESAQHRALAREVANGYLTGPEHLAEEPLYALGLGALFPALGESPAAIAAAQALVGVVILVLVFWLGLRVASAEVGVLAAGLLAAYGPLLHFEGEALPVTMAVATHLVALVAVAGFEADARPWRALGAGALVGLLVWARPWLILVPILCGLIALPGLVGGPKARVRTRLVLAGFVLVGLAMVVTPLFVRSSLSGAPGTLMPARYGLQLYAANHPGATGEDVPPPGFSSARVQLVHEARQLASGAPDRPPASPQEASRHHAVLAVQATLAAPGEALVRLGRKILCFAHAEELPASTSPTAHPTKAQRLARVPFSVFLALGLVGLLFAGIRARTWLWASLAAHLLHGLVMPASSEARITLVPVLAVAAAAAVFHAVGHMAHRPAAPIRGLVALAIGLAMALVPLPGGRRRATEARLSEARSLLSQGRPFAAREVLAPIRARPTRATVSHLEGLACQRLGRHAEALGHLRAALASLPRLAGLHVDLARSYAALAERAAARGDRGEGADRLHEALSHLQKALVLHPDALDGLLLSARLHRAMGQHERARSRLGRAEAVAPADPSVQAELGILAALGRDLDGARARLALARLLGARIEPPWDALLDTRGAPETSRARPARPGSPPRPLR